MWGKSSIRIKIGQLWYVVKITIKDIILIKISGQGWRLVTITFDSFIRFCPEFFYLKVQTSYFSIMHLTCFFIRSGCQLSTLSSHTFMHMHDIVRAHAHHVSIHAYVHSLLSLYSLSLSAALPWPLLCRYSPLSLSLSAALSRVSSLISRPIHSSLVSLICSRHLKRHLLS